MAKTNEAKSKPLALEILMADHRKVEALFEKYEKAKGADDASRRGIAQSICGELTVHARIEEEIFYPWLRETLDDDDMEMVEEAQVEHDGARELIEQIQDASHVDAAYDAKVKVLSEYVKHHVKEEEHEIFPAIAAENEDLDELGEQMQARKVELQEIAMPEGAKSAPPRKPGNSGMNARKGAAR